MTFAQMALIVVGLTDALMLLWAVRTLSAAGRMEQKVTRLADALALLTETAESGFTATAREIGRLASSEQAVKPAPRIVTRRVVGAARRGLPLSAIAAEEQVSEGEVRLRLHLAECEAAARAARTADQEAGHGAMRT